MYYRLLVVMRECYTLGEKIIITIRSYYYYNYEDSILIERSSVFISLDAPVNG
jgi:DNA-directed RNA polymerase beta subunit